MWGDPLYKFEAKFFDKRAFLSGYGTQSAMPLARSTSLRSRASSEWSIWKYLYLSLAFCINSTKTTVFLHTSMLMWNCFIKWRRVKCRFSHKAIYDAVWLKLKCNNNSWNMAEEIKLFRKVIEFQHKMVPDGIDTKHR